jgi:ribonuclease P protein component
VLPKSERLTKNSEFVSVYNLRKSVANPLLVLYIGKKKEDLTIPTKVGFVVGKKIHKRAVKRNRAKRLIREAYRNVRNTDEFLLKDFEALIFLARLPILEADYNQVYDAVRDCIKKAYKKFK